MYNWGGHHLVWFHQVLSLFCVEVLTEAQRKGYHFRRATIFVVAVSPFQGHQTNVCCTRKLNLTRFVGHPQSKYQERCQKIMWFWWQRLGILW